MSNVWRVPPHPHAAKAACSVYKASDEAGDVMASARLGLCILSQVIHPMISTQVFAPAGATESSRGCQSPEQITNSIPPRQGRRSLTHGFDILQPRLPPDFRQKRFREEHIEFLRESGVEFDEQYLL